MAKVQIKAGDEFSLRLSRLADGMDEIAEKALYAGASVAADALRAEIEALPTEDERSTTRRGVSKAERQDLLDGMGVSKMQKSGNVLHIKTGFDGFGTNTKSDKTKYPKGLPIATLARAIQSGTSFRLANRFSTRATNKAKTKAQEAMGKVVKEEIDKKTKG
ncbi:hypothetical protein LJC61_02770 [Ruminococcaceae bacterium OttesenSCG-928-A16]|nr:hypothetical protein [Ruminococcaceae bacterium OttesenSCG-928-A16]